MRDAPHLTEEERQGVADGTLDVAQHRDASAHLSACPDCADDVARLQTLMSRVQTAPAPAASEEDLWPAIRARIEGAKVVRMNGAREGSTAPARRRPWLAAASTLIAATLLVAALVEMQHVRTPPVAKSARPTDVMFTNVADSSQAYEAEANVLLNELEMQRAMLRPNTSAALDSDLAVIDRSIDELNVAIARDPKNIALQRLLAASYREKVELLKRASNAG